MVPYISKVGIKDYKCFGEAAAVLGPHLNVVVGKNNSGKTALLEAIALGRGRARSSIEAPAMRPQDSVFVVEVSVDQDYFWSNVDDLRLPCPNEQFLKDNKLNGYQDFLDWFCSQTAVTFTADYHLHNGEFRPASTTTLYPAQPGGYDGAIFELNWRTDASGRRLAGRPSPLPTRSGDFVRKILEGLQQRTYFLRPDLINPKDSSLSTDGRLAADCGNLAGVLQRLQGMRKGDEFTQLVQEVFPEIGSVTARPAGASTVDVYIWPLADQHERAIRLVDCGRGIAPVLAILYLLHNEPAGCLIIVDEPQAFLHPSALRRLLNLFQRYPEHQFVMASHSPIVVSGAGVDRCPMVVQQDGQSSISAMTTADLNSAKAILDEVGASPHDVFGAETVCWVEGPTEAQCFEAITKAFPELRSKTFTFVPVRATGDFEQKKRADINLVAHVYQQLTKSNGIIPPALAFEFDREDRTPADRAELNRMLDGKALFTKRRMYENYLLNPKAVAHLLNSLAPSLGIEPNAVERILAEKRAEQGQANWNDVHGAQILEDLFRRLTQSTYAYRKTEHAIDLTRWLLDNEPGELEDLREMLREVGSRQTSSQG